MDVNCPSLSTPDDVSLPRELKLDVASSETLFEIDEEVFTADFGEEEITNVADGENKDLDMEAIDFLREIFDSEEYKNRKDVEDVGTQVFPHYLKEFRAEMEEYMKGQVKVEYPLTKYTQQKYANGLIEEARRKCEEGRALLEKQRASLRTIKDTIAEYTRRKDHYSEDRKRRNAIKSEKLEATVRLHRPTSRLTVVSVKNIRHKQTLGRKKRMEEILAKLTHEEEMKRKIAASQSKTYDYKVRRRKRIVADVEIVGEIISPRSPAAEEESVPEEAVFEEEFVEMPEKDKSVIDKKSKESKPKKEKARKKDKGKAKKKAEVEEFTMPEIPVINPRRKIKRNELESMKELVDINKSYGATLDDIEAQRNALFGVRTREKDKWLVCHPNPLIFNDIKNCFTYTKKVSIVNTDCVPKKIKLLKAEIPNGQLLETIQVENFGTHLLVPGLPLTVSVAITPKAISRGVKGEVSFATWTPKSADLGEYALRVKCLPPAEDVTVLPREVNFGTVKYWRARGRTFTRKVRIANESARPCRVLVRRVLESLEFERYLLRAGEEGRDSSEWEGNYFSFSTRTVYLEARCCAQILATLANVDYVGDYYERYQFKIYRKDEGDAWQICDCKDVTLSAETVPYFITVEPETLDFEMTCFDSVYQNKFRIFNTSNLPQRLLVSFPSNLKHCLGCDTPEAIVEGNRSHVVVVRFQPSRDITDRNAFYDEETHILSFPIRVSLVSRSADDYPVLRVCVYAIIVPSLPLVLKPLHDENVTVVYNTSTNNSEFLVDCGTVGDRESVFVRLGLTNDGPAVQHFGFRDVPQYVSISPNYGFGVIEPYQCTVLKVILSPQKRDLYTADFESANRQLHFKLTVTTIKCLGSIKKSFNMRSLRKSIELMESMLRKPRFDDLESDMINCVEHLRSDVDFAILLETLKLARFAEGELSFETELSPDLTSSNSAGVVYDTAVCTKSKRINFEDIKSNTVWFNCILKHNHCSFSHECLLFPKTPCGSYSTMNLDLKFRQKPWENLGCSANFQIFSSNGSIHVEPKCGEIKIGESKRLNVIARPEIPRSIIEEKARQVRRAEVAERKRRELAERRRKESERRSAAAVEGKKSKRANKSSKSGKPKKGKEGRSTKGKSIDQLAKGSASKTEELLEVAVRDSEVVVTPFDLYPAEMILWREFKPYTMEATFTVRVSFPDNPSGIDEELYLNAICNVTMPDFVHNLDTQRIDFGPTAIGDSKRKILEIRNIRNVGIKPKLEKLGTGGVFSCPSTVPVRLPAEHILTLPISFHARDTERVIEFFEIKSGNTRCPLILSGEGVEPQLVFKPDFSVCRLEASGDYADFPIEISNSSPAGVTLTFEKLFELKGEMREPPKPVKTDDEKAKKKNKKSDKASRKSERAPAASPDLTDDERFSIANFFERRSVSAKALFEIVGGVTVEIAPSSRAVVVLRFGTAPAVSEDKTKGKSDRKGKKGKASSKGSKKGKLRSANDPKTYLAKFNVLLGNATFLRDLVVFGRFI